MKKNVCRILMIVFCVSLFACSTTKKENKPRAVLGEEILKSFEKNKEWNNYHMTSIVDQETFDVNVENIDGQQNIAGTRTYVTEVLNHNDFSVIGTRELRDFIYKKGESTMSYREADGAEQYDLDFPNLQLYQYAYENIVEAVESVNSDPQLIESITMEEREDGSKEYIYSEAYHYIVDKNGNLISYTNDFHNNKFTIDNINSVILDYSYCKI